MPPIRIQGLTKTYKAGPRAVDNVAIEIRDGEFMVLVGPSGCGKSTMLQMLAGIDIAMVFQSYALYPHLSVRNNHEVRRRHAEGIAYQRSPQVPWP